MCNQYKARKSYFTKRVLKLRHRLYDVIMSMNDTDFSYYQIHRRKGILGLKYQFIFIYIFNKFRFNLFLLNKSYSLFNNMKKNIHKDAQ